ncbi:MAG: endopeptidase La [Mycoplasma sp.]
METKTNQETTKVIITRGIIILPSVTKAIEIGREKSILTIKNIKVGDKVIVTSQINPEEDDPTFDDVYLIGTICKVKSVNINDDGDYIIELRGITRVKLVDPLFSKVNGFETKYTEIETLKNNPDKCKEILNNIIELFEINTNTSNKKEFKKLTDYISKNADNYELISDFIVNNIEYNDNLSESFIQMQEYLEVEELFLRLEMAFGFLVEHFDDGGKLKNSIDSSINKKMNDNMAKQQKEYYLREKLKIVKEELGEISNKDDDAEKMRKRVNENPYPQYIKEKLLSEISKYEVGMSPNESSMMKTYIDWVLDLPWWQKTEDNKDITVVEEILNKNHYGIEKVKERIIEFLALKSKNPNVKSPILCLVGPPGVGKTSLAISIAEALNKKYVKASLGGVSDEAEIRGHRKTYIGAMPGRIIKGMKKGGVINPLFLLDEIDKIGKDHKGDPGAALLEVLDPEQNSKFSDNYIEEDYDLSNALFLATANYYKQIPEALIDRLEIIELSSYTLPEKMEIAKRHLIPETMKDTLVDSSKLKWTDEALNFLISHYTYEAGVRELQRQIQNVMRKYVVAELKNQELPSEITIEQIKRFLGKIKFDVNQKDAIAIPGIVNGMAYTSAGGDLLPIECTYSPGKGKLTITGNLEKTMNESVAVALGYVKSNAKTFGIESFDFNNNDIHIHVPAGGIPKDGPSAGVAITTALISKISNIPVRTNISMTGEITLRGKVGIIGGVKEKVISAHRAGVREVFLPIEDERFLEEIPKYILDDIKIHLVNEYSEVYKEIFRA